MEKTKNSPQPVTQFQQFFISRLNELVNIETFDSWFIRSSNVLSILKEISEVIQVSRKRESYAKNLEWLILELKRKLSLDIVAAEQYKESSYLVDSMEKIYRSNVSIEKKCNEINKINNIFEKYFDRYFENIEKRLLKVSKEQPDKKYKKELYYLLLEYLTCVKTLGYSISYLKESVDKIFKSDDVFYNKVKRLTESFEPVDKKFSCRFIIQIGPVSNVEGLKKLSIRPPTDKDLSDFGITGGGGQNVCEITDIQAKDCYSAYFMGRNKAEEIISFQTIYRHQKNSQITQGKCLVEDSSGEVREVKFDDFLQNNLIREASNSERKMNEGFENLKKLNDIDRERVQSSIEYHKTAMTSHSNEMTLLNLWIALETLLVDGDPSIIGRISEIVPTMCSLSYAKMTMYSFCKSANMIWKKSPITKEIYSVSGVNVEFLEAKWLLKAMMEKGDDSKNIKRIMSYSPLALYRYDRLENGMFSSKKEHKKCLEVNHYNIKWQIQRIYRVRNSITHRGAIVDNIDQIISNLHNYYHVCLHSILHDIGSENSNSISDSIYHREMARNKYLFDLGKEEREFKITQILNPYHFLLDRDNEVPVLWN